MKRTKPFDGLEALIRMAESGAPLFDETDPAAHRRGGRRKRASLGQRMALRISTGRPPIAR